MIAQMKFLPRSYAEATAYLGRKLTLKLGHNTKLQRIDTLTVAIVYHATSIVTLHADGTVKIDNGGWPTRTTHARINAALQAMELGEIIVRSGGARYRAYPVRGVRVPSVEFKRALTVRDGTE